MKLQEFLDTGFALGCVEYHLHVHKTPHGVTKVALRGSSHFDLECDGVAVNNEIVIFDNPKVE
jgi:hypothetical protein